MVYSKSQLNHLSQVEFYKVVISNYISKIIMFTIKEKYNHNELICKKEKKKVCFFSQNVFEKT